MTPAVNYLKKNKISFRVLEFEHDRNSNSYGLEAVEKLDENPLKVFKTLIVTDLNKNYFTAVVPAVKKLNLRAFAKETGNKKTEIASPEEAARITGYIIGGISPVAQRKKLKTIIDSSAENLDSVIVSAGKRGLEIELSPHDLAKTLNASFAAISE
ncbi:MAG: Cys-tRNA(Pro) deacylase [Desulfobacteraceae bacterium]